MSLHALDSLGLTFIPTSSPWYLHGRSGPSPCPTNPIDVAKVSQIGRHTDPSTETGTDPTRGKICRLPLLVCSLIGWFFLEGGEGVVFEELAKGRASIFAPPTRMCCSSPQRDKSLQQPFWSPPASLRKDGAEAARGDQIRPVLRTRRGDPMWGGGGFLSLGALI